MSSTNVTPGTTVISESRDAVEQDAFKPAPRQSIFSGLTEDWWAVIIGGVLIAGILLFATTSPAFKFTTPAYQWGDRNELLGKVLALNNLLLIGAIGLLFLIISSVSIYLSGGNAGRY